MAAVARCRSVGTSVSRFSRLVIWVNRAAHGAFAVFVIVCQLFNALALFKDFFAHGAYFIACVRWRAIRPPYPLRPCRNILWRRRSCLPPPSDKISEPSMIALLPFAANAEAGSRLRQSASAKNRHNARFFILYPPPGFFLSQIISAMFWSHWVVISDIPRPQTRRSERRRAQICKSCPG